MAAVAPAPGPAASVLAFAPPRAGRARLRVGVFADAPAQPRWAVEALARVGASDFAELAFVAVLAGAVRAPRPGLAWRAYARVDRLLFGGGADWTAPADATLLVPAARRLALDAADPAALAARFADARLDVAIVLGAVDDDLVAGLARHGAWRHCFGEAHDAAPQWAAVREVAEGRPVVASGLRIRQPGAPDRVACRSWSRALGFSLARSHEGLLPKTAEFLARALRDLHAGGAAWLEQAAVPVDAEPAPARPRAGLAAVARVGVRIGRQALEKATSVGQWQLALRFDDAAAGGPGAWNGSLAGWHRLVPPRDRFWADPFAAAAGGRHYVFFEELPFAAGRAHISVVEVDREGRASEPVRVLERDYHLSYPFLVEDEGRLYMIPESAHNHCVEIYRCVEFPHRWKRERTLLDGLWVADATVHREGGRWWMFATVGREGAEVNDELHVFTADRLLGDWKPHRANPVKSDVRGARPAGRPWREGGALVRPAQVCAPLYGSGIALQRVTRLDEHGYAEEERARIAPAAGEGVLGVHTVNRCGPLVVADAFVRRRRLGP